MGLSATMPKARGHGIEGLQALKDQIIGPSGWREVTQEMINQFAELSVDDIQRLMVADLIDVPVEVIVLRGGQERRLRLVPRELDAPS